MALHSTYVAVFNSTYRRMIFNDIIFGITSESVQAMSFDFSVIHAGALLRIDGRLYLIHNLANECFIFER